MKRVLFVDDDPQVLEGMRRALRRLRNEWDMHFATSAKDALDLLAAEEPFDVLVTDMCMPGMSGAELLGIAQAKAPGMVRVILSGRSEADQAMRMATCAHQFLTKPCDSERIRTVVGRSLHLHESLADEQLQAVVGQLRSLPSLPAIYVELAAAIADEEVTIARVAEIVERDAGIAAKLLQLVNSSFFGVPRSVDSLRDAISFLGLTTIKALVLQYGIVEEFDPSTAAPSFDIEDHQRRALAVGSLARRILSDDRRLSEGAFVAGILHDIGDLVLATNRPDLYERVRRLSKTGRIPPQELERRAIGVTHGEVGAYLLGLWGMPDPIVEAALLHHRPTAAVGEVAFDHLAAVHLADALLSEARGSGEAALDRELVAALGLGTHLPGWREEARAMAWGKGDDAA